MVDFNGYRLRKVYKRFGIYTTLYRVLFGPVKPELGVIPSGQENHSGAEHLNFPGRELNVIDFTKQYFFKEKTKDFSSCFWFTPETKNRMEINL